METSSDGGEQMRTWHGKHLIILAVAGVVALIAKTAWADDRPWIGMDIMDRRLEGSGVGVTVLRIEEESPASAAGIASGDVVIAIEDQPLMSADDLVCKVFVRNAGQRTRLTVLRDGATFAAVVTLGLWPLNVPQGPYSCPVPIAQIRRDTGQG
jgi:S1-C subfamily serine protease